jgi:hypothetical protein
MQCPPQPFSGEKKRRGIMTCCDGDEFSFTNTQKPNQTIKSTMYEKEYICV